MVRIVKCDRNISITEWFTVFRSCKNNVLHTGTTQLLGALFTKYPAHCIPDITLATAVWPDNSSDPIMKIKNDLVRK